MYFTVPAHERKQGRLEQARALKGYFVGYSYSSTYALSNDSLIESSGKSAGAPAVTNLSHVKLDILMGMFVKFQDSVELHSQI